MVIGYAINNIWKGQANLYPILYVFRVILGMNKLGIIQNLYKTMVVFDQHWVNIIYFFYKI